MIMILVLMIIVLIVSMMLIIAIVIVIVIVIVIIMSQRAPKSQRSCSWHHPLAASEACFRVMASCLHESRASRRITCQVMAVSPLTHAHIECGM